nr:MAG TPA: hypothetical protein [Microviridae sp.]
MGSDLSFICNSLQCGGASRSRHLCPFYVQ